MPEREAPASTPSPPTPASHLPVAQQSGETGWTMALKSIFWLLLVPGGVVLLVRWFLQP